MKYMKKILCLVIGLMLTAFISSCSVQSKMSEPQPEPANLSQPQPREREKRNGDIFVSPLGATATTAQGKTLLKQLKRLLNLQKNYIKRKESYLLLRENIPFLPLRLQARTTALYFMVKMRA